MPGTKTVLLTGCITQDISYKVDKYPAEDSACRASAVTRSYGGNAYNSAYVLQQLSQLAGNKQVNVQLIGSVPERFTASASNDAAWKVINTQSLIEQNDVAEWPTSTILLSKQTASRTIVHYRGDMPEVSAHQFDVAVSAMTQSDNVSIAHFEARPNIDDIILMMKSTRARYPNCLVSVEIEKPRGGREVDMMPLADVIIVSNEYATADQSRRREEFATIHAQHLQHRPLVVCPAGAEGAYILSDAAGSVYSHVPTDSLLAPIVDTRGAGDSFNAALLLTLSRGDTPSDAVSYANTVAGLKCTGEGLDLTAVRDRIAR